MENNLYKFYVIEQWINKNCNFFYNLKTTKGIGLINLINLRQRYNEFKRNESTKTLLLFLKKKSSSVLYLKDSMIRNQQTLINTTQQTPLLNNSEQTSD